MSPVSTYRNNASEAELQKYVEDLLRIHGWLWHHAGDSRRSTAGLPDIVAVRYPRVIFAELKTAKGRLRPDQAEWIHDLERCAGVEVYLWRPADMDDIAAILA